MSTLASHLAVRFLPWPFLLVSCSHEALCEEAEGGGNALPEWEGAPRKSEEDEKQQEIHRSIATHGDYAQGNCQIICAYAAAQEAAQGSGRRTWQMLQGLRASHP
ncbi:hypothetical protein BDZ90DRAFT_260631 [Jaminaea rosea]|uniref:Secreted protein n=1 Tax=Jaminaea rosea TaxID=1569628 RepID=A0A316UUH9_9BASI|nr:hypothetical protein BDZ90DRAFT_260631 [Jaminaea rosea]PWN27563.1 hypothetical protein BDZ90DRAFT_260631 [Jaminaea rosea]